MATDFGYPTTERPPFFAMKFIRKMVKECVAQEVGQTGFILLSVIASTEDAVGYRRSISFTDVQLLPILGVSSTSTISIARKKCVDAGWLHYVPGCRGRASRYWVKVPKQSVEIDDQPADEGDTDGLDPNFIPSNERIPIESNASFEQTTNAGRVLLPGPCPSPHPHHRRILKKDGDDNFASPNPPPVVLGMLNYDDKVVIAAWSIARQFAKLNPERRSIETVTKIVSRFAGCISKHGNDAIMHLESYYSLKDAATWQTEVDAGKRLPVNAPPLEVCNFLKLSPFRKIEAKPSSGSQLINSTTKRLEAQDEGKKLLADGKTITEVMSILERTYGLDIAYAAAKVAGWMTACPRKARLRRNND